MMIEDVKGGRCNPKNTWSNIVQKNLYPLEIYKWIIKPQKTEQSEAKCPYSQYILAGFKVDIIGPQSTYMVWCLTDAYLIS